MILTNENGVTIQALIITIVLLLILVSIGTTAGTSALEYSKYSKLKTEMQLLQTKVNELNEKKEYSNGQELTDAQKAILNKKEISDIIYNNRSEEDKVKVINGFRYFTPYDIKNTFDLDGIERGYLINVEYRYVVSCEGLKYKNNIYYITDQMDGGIYNVEYHNKNKNPDKSEQAYEVTTKAEGDECKIVVTITNYGGYVNYWQVKYKLNTEEKWHISNNLEFVVEKSGTYNIKVVHGDEIDLGQQNIDVDAVVDYKKQDGGWNGVSNSPKIMTGMVPVYFDDNNNTVELTENSKDEEWKKWFSYDNKKWANAITKNSEGQITGYWVWIPRYEYKISGKNVDVKFIRTSKKQVDKNYDHIHPAFEDGSEKGKNNHYMNGEWRDEIPGFWVAKFQAGFASGNNDVTKVQSSTGKDFPVFLGRTYAYNIIRIGEAYELARNLTASNNIYGLDGNETDSHMSKNSEWGAVEYLTQSSYGLDGEDVLMSNNVYVKNSGGYYVFGITGYANKNRIGTYNASIEKPPYGDVITNEDGKITSYAWYTEIGQRGSSTQNITGVYDLAGCLHEMQSAYITNGSQTLIDNAKQFANTNKNVEGYKTYSTEHVTTYPYDESNDNSDSNLKKYFSLKNDKYGYGDGILEFLSLNGENFQYVFGYNYLGFPFENNSFCGRGGPYHWGDGAKFFIISGSNGYPFGDWGFRAILIGIK